MIPRFDEPVCHSVRYRERQGTYAIIPHGGLVLLTHQLEPKPEYQLPGGGVDSGEFPLAALIRETLEETGWKIQVVSRFGAYRRFAFLPDYGIWARKTCRIYLARPNMHAGPPLEKSHSAVWATPTRAIEILSNEGDRAMMQRFIHGFERGSFVPEFHLPVRKGKSHLANPLRKLHCGAVAANRDFCRAGMKSRSTEIVFKF